MDTPTPKRVRRYRTWMSLPKPKPPRSTAYRNIDVELRGVDPATHRAQLAGCQGAANKEQSSATDTHANELSDNVQNSMLSNQDDDGHSIQSASPSHSSSSTDTFSVSSLEARCESSEPESFSGRSFTSSIDSTIGDHTQANFESDNSGSEYDSESGFHCPRKEENLDEPILQGLKTTKFEALLMVLNFSFRHGLTDVARNDLCLLINQLLGSDRIPCSTYWFKKVFGSVNYSLHFYCSSCGCYICEVPSDKPKVGILDCPVQSCQTKCNLKTFNDGNFFATLPVREQLKFVLENTENVQELLNYRWNRSNNDEICDVFDGAVYKQLSTSPNILHNKSNISISFNTDGAASLFKSSPNSLWPIHFRINEFPPNVRFDQRNNLVAGIWFGKHPDMSLFLSPFVTELGNLYTEGFQWMASPTEKITSKVILLQGVFDSVAKPKVQNIHQFNGAFGCGYCFHPGVVLADIPSNHAKYLVDRNICMYEDFSTNYTVTKYIASERREETFCVEDRIDNDVRDDMGKAERLKENSTRTNLDEIHVRGIKGYSVLFSLFYLDLVFGFAIDYMHNTLLGVCKTVTNLWLDDKSDFCVGERVFRQMESRLKGITPPSCLSRLPRPLSERVHWKANEWRAWLLFYSVPCAMNCIPRLHFNHHCLLVSASFILLKDKITREELTQAARYLIQYVVDYQNIYGKPNMFYNVHLLLHLPKMVNLYGPLWCYSAFTFESANGYLMRLVKGTKGVITQIAEKYSISKLLVKTMSMYTVRSEILEFCQDLMCYRMSSVSSKISNVTVLGLPRYKLLKVDEKEFFEQTGSPTTNYSYERFIKGGVMYHARCYSRRGKKSDDSVVQLMCGTYGVIERILLDNDNNIGRSVNILLKKVMTEMRPLIIRMSNSSSISVGHITRCAPIVYGPLILRNAEEVLRKVILMRCHDDTFISNFPNFYEKD